LSGIGLLQKEGRRKREEEERGRAQRSEREQLLEAREMHEDRKEDKRGINGREGRGRGREREREGGREVWRSFEKHGSHRKSYKQTQERREPGPPNYP
jgi:hypothetical protein